MHKIGRLKLAILFTLAVSLLHCLSGVLWAQAGNDVANALDNRLRSAARVDPVTRAMQLNLNLGTYPGRAGTSEPLILSYSSKQWEVEYLASYGVPGSDDTVNTYIPKFSSFAAGGWTTSLDYIKRPKPGLPFGYSADGMPVPYGSPGASRVVPRLYVDLPTGTRHELRRDDGVYNIGTSMAGVYYSVDGSRLKFETATSTLWLPDGSRYVNGVFTDRNGNQKTYGSNGSVQDSMGRALNFSLPYGVFGPTVGDVTYQLPGRSGGVDTITLRWRRLENARTNPADPLHYPAPRFTQLQPGYPGPFLFTSSGTTNDELVSQGVFNPVLLQQIVLPNGSTYSFTYNVFGEINRIVHPSGAVEEFTYGQVAPVSTYFTTNGTVDAFFLEANRGVTQHRISPSGNGNDWMTYQGSYSPGGYWSNAVQPAKSVVTAPDGTKAEKFVFGNADFSGSNGLSPAFGFEDTRLSLPYDERDLSPSGDILRRKLTEYAVDGGTSFWGNGRPMHKARNPRPVRTVEIVIENGAAVAKTTGFTYDQNLNVLTKTEYGFVSVSINDARTSPISFFPSGTLIRTTETDYVTDPNYLNRNLISLPSAVRVRDGAANLISQTQYVYDESDLPVVFYAGAPTGWVNPNTTIRGNVTRTRRWLNPSNTWIETRAQYDQFGNVIKSWDELQRMTETDYSVTYQYAYPTLMRTPAPDLSGTRGSAAPFATTTVYDFNTGLPTSVTDLNGQVTTMEYNDSLNRLTATNPPSGAGRREYVYGDTPGNLFTRLRVEFESGRWTESTRFFDGLGRESRTEQADAGGNAFVDTQYDTMGRLWRVSNPYRVGDTVRWMTSAYDSLGRLTATTTPDNASVTTAFGLVTSGTIGLTVTTTDEAGKLRRTVLDALGRVVRVDETDAANQLGPVTAPVQATNYAYNVLDNLTQVTQGGQGRTFAYDSLERLTSMSTPEAGSTTYVYDAAGNPVQRTDARGTVVNYQYDRLNRQTLRTYTPSSGVGATSQAEYFYDGTGLTGITPSFANGQLTRASNGSATREFRTFNPVGRVLSARQVIDGNTYDSAYTYNLAGQLVNETYPSGRVVTNAYGADASLASVNGRGPGRPIQLYASNFEYGAHGGETKLQYGNGLILETAFNTRLQRSAITLRQQANTLWNVSYDYGTTDNNGTVKTQSILHPGITQPLVQTFTHDSLNRLTVARETQTGVEQWKQTFTYDRFGNRSVVTGQTTPSLIGLNPVINPANNRITPQVGELYAYDAAGNLVTDRDGKRFVFDGDHRVTGFALSQTNLNNQVFAGEYRFDVDGRRVKKVVGNVTTLFVYDAFGKLMGEYTINAPTTTPRTQYLTADAVSNQRVISNGQGVVTARRDFAPFGEELPANPTIRPTSLGYQSPTDVTRQRFNGNERDEESGLDLVGPRQYASNAGRFTAPDPVLRFLEADDQFERGRAIVTPQGWNRYLQAQNSPTAVDPGGRASLVAYGAGVGAIGGEPQYLRRQYLSPAANAENDQTSTEPSQFHSGQTKRILVGVIEDRKAADPAPRSVPLQSVPKAPKPGKSKSKKKDKDKFKYKYKYEDKDKDKDKDKDDSKDKDKEDGGKKSKRDGSINDVEDSFPSPFPTPEFFKPFEFDSFPKPVPKKEEDPQKPKAPSLPTGAWT